MNHARLCQASLRRFQLVHSYITCCKSTLSGACAIPNAKKEYKQGLENKKNSLTQSEFPTYRLEYEITPQKCMLISSVFRQFFSVLLRISRTKSALLWLKSTLPFNMLMMLHVKLKMILQLVRRGTNTDRNAILYSHNLLKSRDYIIEKRTEAK